MEDFERTYEEKRSALVMAADLPVAVRDRQTLARLGNVMPIPGVSVDNAVRLRTVTHLTLKNWLPEHIWVNPDYSSYRNAWANAGLYVSPNGHLDHLHSKKWAKRAGYGYVVLIPVRLGVNMSAGTLEKKEADVASTNLSNLKPIYYGNYIHWAKLWKLKIDLKRD